MFSLDGLFANIVAEVVGILGGIVLTLLIVNWWLERRERLRWRPIEVIALKRVEHLAEILARLQAAATGTQHETPPLMTLDPHLVDVTVGGNLREFPPESATDVYGDPQWPRAIREATKRISEDLLRYPVVASRLPSLMVDLERLQVAAARWEEFVGQEAEQGIPAFLPGGLLLALVDGVTARTRTLDLAASCIEQARVVRRPQERPRLPRRAWIRVRRVVAFPGGRQRDEG